MGTYNYPIALSYISRAYAAECGFWDLKCKLSGIGGSITQDLSKAADKADQLIAQGQQKGEDALHKGGVDYLSSPDLHQQVQNLASNKGHDATVDALNQARGTISQYLPFILAGVIGLAVLFYFL